MVDRLSDINDSVATNFDSLISVSRHHEIANPSLIEELIREVTRLRQEVSQVKQELE